MKFFFFACKPILFRCMTYDGKVSVDLNYLNQNLKVPILIQVCKALSDVLNLSEAALLQKR